MTKCMRYAHYAMVRPTNFGFPDLRAGSATHPPTPWTWFTRNLGRVHLSNIPTDSICSHLIMPTPRVNRRLGSKARHIHLILLLPAHWLNDRSRASSWSPETET